MGIKKKISRNNFIKTMTVTGAAIASSSVLEPTLNAFAQSKSGANRESGEWKPTTCQGCTSWCSIQAYVVNGRAIKLRGNPNSKVNGISGCPRQHMSLQQVYDPDRLKVPMKRTNPKKGRDEDPKFVPISWDEALDTIADKIMDLRNNNETHKYMLMRGRYSYMRDIIYDRMTKIIGSPNNISHSAICAEAEKFGPYYTEGLWAYRQYDVANTRYMILWGSDPVSANRQVSYYLSAWGDMLDKARVAVIDPRLSASATKADEWLPIKPGEDGALASAFAHVILTKGMWYKDFVGDFNEKSPVKGFVVGKTVPEEVTPGVPTFNEIHTHGLLKWWNIELKDKTPEWASKRTGIPVEQILRVATEYANAAPHAICWVGGGPSMQVRGAYGSMATHALNGLVGSVDNVGGTLAANKEYSKGFPAADDFYDDIATAGKKHKKIDHRGTKEFPALNEGKSGGGVVTNNAAVGILNDDPNDIKVAIAYMNNFAFSCPGTERWEKALSKIPFIAHLTTHASEFSWFADILLPCAHATFEKWGYVKVHGNGHRHVTLLEPVNKLFWDVKIDETEVPWLIAQKLADRGFDNLLRHYQEYKDPETGKAPANDKEFAIYSLKIATEDLWNPDNYKGGDKINGWEDMKARGVWNSDPYPFRKRWSNMKTKTKKFEFYSETLKAALEGHAEKHNTTVDDVLETCKYQARGELAFVPHYEEPFVWGDAKEYPLQLVDYKSRFNREGRSANCAWYQELKDYDPGDKAWDDVAKINPLDAERLGIKDGSRIKLISTTGEIECTASLWEGAQPGTVAKCYGQGHWAYRKIAAKKFGKVPRGGNNNTIIPADYDRLSGSSAFYSLTRVKIVTV